jgi:TIR domain
LKVFISHSSLDKWIARRVSKDLEALGATTFLDEKDIETGDSIDDAIQEHLSECDEILMILSPAALSSHWVLLEIGGAKALGMRLIPILLHVGPNDLPAPLGKGLARDLNDIEKYYEEVTRRLHGRALPEAPRPRRSAATSRAEAASRKRRTFGVGDLVRIPDQPQPAFITPATQRVAWKDGMTAHAGKTATVTFVDEDRTVRLDVSPSWWWAMDWLDPLERS